MNKRPMLAMLILSGCYIAACAPSQPVTLLNPALEYSNNLHARMAAQGASQGRSASAVASAGVQKNAGFQSVASANGNEQRAQLRLASAELPLVKMAVETGEASARQPLLPAEQQAASAQDPAFNVYPSSQTETRDYNGPLSFGDPGMSASLWKESRGGNDLFRDDRAWQPMDLITIVVSESAEGKKEADTEVKQKSTVKLAIENLLGLEKAVPKRNSNIDLANAVNASSQNDFKGEGGTSRKDTLKARMSAMIVEVLPSGILRLEGQKIVSVNNEEQIMVISGLVRPRDVSSSNEVDSSKIANMRIDYYGSGTLAEAQHGGWAARAFRVLWPF